MGRKRIRRPGWRDPLFGTPNRRRREHERVRREITFSMASPSRVPGARSAHAAVILARRVVWTARYLWRAWTR